MLSYHHYLAFQSFNKKFIGRYFTTLNIIKGFFIAILLSSFLLLEYFKIEFWVIYFFSAFAGITFLLSQKKEVFFWSGFFIGVFWFYWISFSFTYYHLTYLMPLGLIGVGCVYGFLFWFMAIIHEHPFVKGAMLFLVVTYIHPVGFNWLDFRLLLVRLPCGVDKLSLAFFIGFCASFLLSGYRKMFFILFLAALMFLAPRFDASRNMLPFSVKLIETHIQQDEKWAKNFRPLHVQNSLYEIKQAIDEKKRVIVLPESAFPLHLNVIENLTDKLKILSKDIVIVAGALTYENEKFYNSTYVFQEGKMDIFHKVILVPFGEQIPLPGFVRNIINYLFYNEAEDFSAAKNPQDFFIDGVKIRNAICFEATKEELFEKNPKFMIAISNNAWFLPSTEPLLQHLLLKLYASLHQTTIYHSANGSKSEIIFPRKHIFLTSNYKLYF